MYLPWVVRVPVAASFHNERVTVDIVCLALLVNILIFIDIVCFYRHCMLLSTLYAFIDIVCLALLMDILIFILFLDFWISFHKNSLLPLYCTHSREKTFIAS